MPSIDDFKIKKKTKTFERFRGWDSDLISKLTISNSDSNKEKSSIKKQHESTLSQNSAKPDSIQSQTAAKITSNISRLTHKHKPETESNVSQKTEQAQDTSFLSLVGLQRKLVIYIYTLCKHVGEKITMPLSIENAAMYVETTVPAARKALQRLVEKNMITRVKSKAGRGGWTQYGLTAIAHKELNHYDSLNMLKENYEPNLSQYRAVLESDLKPTISSSSSINKTTTITNKSEKMQLPMEWQEIDFEPLEKIRFHKGHVEQLFKHGLEFQPVQESIYHFSFDLTANNKGKDIKTDPLGFFMGIMKRSGYYAAPENYESPQEQGKRLFLEQEAKKAQKKLQAEKELMMSYFELWVNQFTEQEKIDLVGKTELGPNRTMLTTEHKLVMHYKNTIWPEQYKKILTGVS